MLTHQFEGRRPGGFAMTYSTLASIVKYPFQSTLANEHGKFGFFSSEKDDFCRVADELGMIQQYTSEGEVRSRAILLCSLSRQPMIYAMR